MIGNHYSLFTSFARFVSPRTFALALQGYPSAIAILAYRDGRKRSACDAPTLEAYAPVRVPTPPTNANARYRITTVRA